MHSQAERERRYGMLTADQRDALVRRHRSMQVFHGFVLFITFVCICVVWAPIGNGIRGLLGEMFPLPAMVRDRVSTAVAAALLAVYFLGPPVMFLVFGVRSSRRTLAMQEVGRVTCGSCEYPLKGLPVENGRVKCPECGRSMELAAFGTLPEDLAGPILEKGEE